MNWFVFRQHEAYGGLLKSEPAIIIIEAFDHLTARSVLAGLPITGLNDPALTAHGGRARWTSIPSQAYQSNGLIYDCAFDPFGRQASCVGYFEIQDWVNNRVLNRLGLNVLVVLSDGARLTYRPQ